MKCDKCGQFIKGNSKYSWAAIYSFMGLDHEAFRCEKCTKKHGIIQSNAEPQNGDMTTYQGLNTYCYE